MHRQPSLIEASATQIGSKKAKKVAQNYDIPDTDDYLAIYETIDRKQSNVSKNKSHSMEDLETPTPSLKSFDISEENGLKNGHNRSKKGRQKLPSPPQKIDVPDSCTSMSAFLKRALRLEGPQLTQKTVAIKKNVRESLGMRIGGGIGSNEGDTPIYVANIHPHGCIGKSKQLKVIN